MLPYKSIISVQRELGIPIYLQICNAFIKNISNGTIASGLKLPGSRKLSELLGVSRKTVISALDELQAQGWVETKPNQGCFVSSKIPIAKAQPLESGILNYTHEISSFPLNEKFEFLEYHQSVKTSLVDHVIDAGYPDVRLAPMRSLSKNLNGIVNGKRSLRLLNYSDHFNGDPLLCKEVIRYLSETRSINVGEENCS